MQEYQLRFETRSFNSPEEKGDK